MLNLLQGYINLIQDEEIKRVVRTLFKEKVVQMCMEHASSYSGHNHPEDPLFSISTSKSLSSK